MIEAKSITQEQELWEAWFAENRPSHLHALVDFYQDWSVSLARKFFFEYNLSSYELNDYIGWATVGLLESINRYEPVGGAQFKSYAYYRIKGEVLNQVNKATEQTAQRLSAKKYEDRIKSLNQKRYEENEDGSVSEDFQNLFDVTVGLMLGNLLESDTLEIAQEDNFVNDIFQVELNQKIKHIFEELASKERRVLRYHYYYNLKFIQISKIMGITKGRVSQIHSDSLCKIQSHLKDSDFEVFL